jgi:hypothetical protein
MRRSDQRQLYDELLGVIRGVRRRWRVRLLMRGLALTGAVALIGFLAAGLVVDRMAPSPEVVTGMRVALLGVVAVAAILFLVRPLLRRVPDAAVALYLEEHEPSLEAAVLSALEARSDDDDATPALAANPLLRRTLESAIQRCHRIEDGRFIEQKALVRVAAMLAAVVVAGALVGFLGPAARGGAASLLSGPGEAEAAGTAAVLVTPGNATVARGADVSINARLRGFEAELVELAVRAPGDSVWDRLPMAAAPDGRFGYLLFDLDADTEYFVEAGDLRAGPFTLTVAELPYVERLDLELVFPAYTGLPSQVVEDGGDVAALRGTTVRVRVTPTVPVGGGGIVVDGADPIPLTMDSATGRLTGAFTVRSDGFYRIVMDAPGGGSLDASPRYVIDAMSDGEPIVSFAEPGRDERATAVDEMFVEARAEDDYGIGRLTLHYAVNGGEEQTVELYGGRGGLQEVSAGHTFYLEEYGLEPGDLVAYWATAADNDAVDGEKTATSDIYFIQIRPFSREFTAADQRQPPGQQQQQGEQAPDGDLSELQRQIVAGTFNLVRDRDDYSDEEARENLNTLALSQERLRDQTRTLAQRMVARQVTRDTGFLKIAEILPQAAEEMEDAARLLREDRPRDALGPEQRALQHLQRAESIFREIQLSMGQQGGGGQQGPTPNAEDLADLFELEMDKLEDQYETVDRGGQEPQDSVSAEVDETAERLEDLARRQQRETERQRREAMQGRGTAGGQAQRQLAEEVEEEARRLERLSRERSQPQLQEAARNLREAAESMRRTAAGADQGEEARDRLREASRQLERSQAEALERQASEARREAERMAREQREIRAESEDLLDAEPGEDRQRRLDRLDARKAQQQTRVDSLERELRELAGQAGSEQPEASRQLQEAAGELSDNRVRDKIDFSRQLRRADAPERYIRDLEESIEEDLDRASNRLAGIEDAFRNESASDDDAERALERAADLARGLESMRQRTDEMREQQSGSPNGPGGLNQGARRQQRSEARQRLEDAQELRQQLRAQGLGAEELDGIVRGLQDLLDDRPYEDAEELARLQAALADQAKRLELGLRVGLTGEDRLRLFLSGNPDVDPEYRALVEEYYRSLSRENERR